MLSPPPSHLLLRLVFLLLLLLRPPCLQREKGLRLDASALVPYNAPLPNARVQLPTAPTAPVAACPTVTAAFTAAGAATSLILFRNLGSVPSARR